MAKIITVPNPVLREKSKEVLLTDKKTLELVKLLKETLTITEGGIKGVGLAAVQIGILKRIFIAYSKKSKKFLTFINPAIIWRSKVLIEGVPESNNKYEGCLSVPNRWAILKRFKAIKIKYQTESGQIQTRKFSGIMAVVIQHEYDHLNGILFVDRALELKAKIYELIKDEDGKESLREINLMSNYSNYSK